MKLPRAFYARDTRTVAKELLGKALVHVDGGVRRGTDVVKALGDEAFRALIYVVAVVAAIVLIERAQRRS